MMDKIVKTWISNILLLYSMIQIYPCKNEFSTLSFNE